MPALPSLFKGRKKAAQAGPSKSAFSYLRGEPLASVVSPSGSSPRSFAPADTSEVIDINERNAKYSSLDFDGGQPDEFENDLIDAQRRQPTPEITPSPRVQLDIEISSPEGLTDWFESKFRTSTPPSVHASGSSNEVGVNILLSDGPKLASGVVAEGEGEDASQSASSTEDVLANLEAMDSSHFGQLAGPDNFKRQDHSNHPYKNSPPKPISIPKNQNGRTTDPPSSFKSARSPLETPASSAISGTTIARALLSNTFVLTTDSRLSRHRSGLAGLARKDSVTLPRAEYSFGGSYDDSFIISADAPPIPQGADLLYQPPKKSRTGNDQRDPVLKRRSSTGSIHPKALPPTPSSSSRPLSSLLSPGVEFDLATFIPTTPEPDAESPPSRSGPGAARMPRSPRSPLPPTPKLAYTVSEDGHSTKRTSDPEEYQVAVAPSPSLYSNVTSPDLNILSPAPSSEPQSAKDLEGVLNYYSIPESPSPGPQATDSYRPAFSPITEESSAQLSPPTPYKSDKRESKRSTPAPMGARPSTGSLRKPSRSESLSGPRGQRQNSLVAVAERPRSITQAPSSPTSAHSSASFGSAGSDLLAPPVLSNIFNRARAGSAPSPIKVVRDSKDGTTYKITVSSRADSETPTSPEEGDTSDVKQEFPETPALFSPLLTGEANTGNVSASMSLVVDSIEVPAMPDTPRSATIPRTQSPPNVAQHMLHRAGTTIVHSRQNSLSKTRIAGGLTGGRVRPASPSNLRIKEGSVGSSSPRSNGSRLSTIPDSPADPNAADELPKSAETPEEGEKSDSSKQCAAEEIQRSPSRGASILSQRSDSSSMYTPSVSESARSRQKSLPPIPPSPHPPRSSIASSLSASSRHSSVHIPASDNIPSRVPSPIPEAQTPPVVEDSPSVSLVTDLPVPEAPSSPTQSPIIAPIVSSPSTSVLPLPADSASVAPSPPAPQSHTTLYIPPPPTGPPPSPPSPTIHLAGRLGRVKTTPPSLTIAQGPSSRTENTVAVNGSEGGASQDSPEIPPAPPSADATVAPPAVPNTLRPRENLTVTPEGFTGRASDIFRGTSLGSPPPYYEAINDATTPHNVNPPAAFPGNSNFAFPGHQSNNSTGEAGPSNPSSSGPRTPTLARDSSMSMRGRMRPPLPAGPRRPSQMMLGNFPGGQFRDRSGSISSVGSNYLQHGPRPREISPTFSPQFQTPTPRWRGLTMEAAKWTFTSAQLQAIVSRAIRQSAEASSIRLLRLEVLDVELPEELRRLEAARTELKSRFRILVKRRNGLVAGLSMYVSGEEDGTVYAPRMMEELKEVTAHLDRLTEELHSLDSQIAHLELLVQVHSGSALAMALRKLNSSFVKQVTENQTLRDRVQALEAERDEAWRQAENIATELDNIHERFESAPSSKRSSRVSAVKKSSIRVSKAGLRSSGSRFSQLSSAASGAHTFGLTPRSPMPRTETIPPVPPMPKPRPMTISTDIPMTSPAPPSSSNHFDTPTSETRALVAAQEELYAMLGITNPDRQLRRSFSFSMASGSSPTAGAVHTSHLPPLRSPGTRTSSRRASLPGNTMMSDAYQAMAADRNAILATIDMLSSTD